MHSATLLIVCSFRMAVQLKLIKGGRRLLQQSENGVGEQFLFEMSHRLAEGQIEEELDKADQVPTPAAAVAVEQVFGGIDVEGGVRFLV